MFAQMLQPLGLFFGAAKALSRRQTQIPPD